MGSQNVTIQKNLVAFCEKNYTVLLKIDGFLNPITVPDGKREMSRELIEHLS